MFFPGPTELLEVPNDYIKQVTINAMICKKNQRVCLPIEICDQEGIWKTQFFADSLSPKKKLPCNNLKNIKRVIGCTFSC